MCWRLSKLSEEGKMDHGMASNVKAWTTTQVGCWVSIVGHPKFADSMPHLAALLPKLHWRLATHSCAYVPAQGREVVAMARELLGGNGVVADFLVGKQFCDMEVLSMTSAWRMVVGTVCCTPAPLTSHLRLSDLAARATGHLHVRGNAAGAVFCS